MRMTGGEALVRALAAEGVRTVFGIPGTHNLAVYDALLDVPAVRHIGARHEQGAAFMADGYARAGGQVGVCLSTTGPAALNLFTALGTAYGDSSAVLAVASEIPSRYVGQEKGCLHECRDQAGLFRLLLGWCGQPGNVAAIPAAVREAFRRLCGGRPRPAALQLSCDVLDSTGEATILTPVPIAPPPGQPDEVARAARLLNDSHRPVLWAGGGVISSDASAALVRLAERLQAPVFTTTLGKGAIPDDHRLALGTAFLKRPGRSYLAGCDLLLAVGTRFTELETRRWALGLPGQVVQIDIDPAEIGRNYPVAAGVIGDARQVMEQLAALVAGARPDRSAEAAEVRRQVRDGCEGRSPEALRLVRALRAALPRDTIVVNDLTVAAYWGQVALEVFEPRTYLYPWGFAPLGFALPAALGARLARPDRPVVALAGDGGFLFTGQELATAVQYGVPVVVVVFNDSAFGVLRPQQQKRYGRTCAIDLVNPDFVALARAFGAGARRVQAVEELGPALREALEAGHPWLIEFPVALPWPV